MGCAPSSLVDCNKEGPVPRGKRGGKSDDPAKKGEGTGSGDPGEASAPKGENDSAEDTICLQRGHMGERRGGGVCEDTKSLDNSYKMLLVGETGVGKTSFIELMENYVEMGGEGFDMKQLTSYTTEMQNKSSTMDSSTTEISAYDIINETLKMTIIDTPGVGNTRSIDSSDVNKYEKAIMEIIKNVNKTEFINCVCFVINGTQARLTKYMKAVMHEVITMLPPEMLESIMILFTKTGSKLQLNYEIDSFNSEFELKINPQHVFILDNPYARHYNAKEKNIVIDLESQRQEFEAAFKVLKDMRDIIVRFSAKQSKTFGYFHIQMDGIQKNCVSCRNISDELLSIKHQLDKIQLRSSNIKQKISQDVTLETLGTTNYICLEQGCFSNCHYPCECTGDQCINLKDGKCLVCGHSSKEHVKGPNIHHDQNFSLFLQKSLDEKHGLIQSHVNELQIAIKQLKQWTTPKVMKQVYSDLKVQLNEISIFNSHELAAILEEEKQETTV